TSATSGGSASAASSRCAAPRDAAPLITASRVANAAASAVSRSQGPGLGTALGTTDLCKAPAKIAERAGTRDVRHAVEVVRRRRRRRVPLERVGDPRVVAGAAAGARRRGDG